MHQPLGQLHVLIVFLSSNCSSARAGGSRLEGAQHFPGGPKFEIKHESRCFQAQKPPGSLPPHGAGPEFSYIYGSIY